MVNQFDVYWVDLNPTVGAEMQKIRPCVIVSPKARTLKILNLPNCLYIKKSCNIFQSYEKNRFIGSQFNTFDLQNAFCKSNFGSIPKVICNL